MSKKILFVVNVDWFFLSHRLPIALAAKKQGYEVHVAVSITDKLAELQSHGFTIHPLVMARGKAGLAKEFQAFVQLIRLFSIVRPDIVHLVTIKPVIYGGIAARLARVPAVVAAISGLGLVYADTGLRAACKRVLVGALYRLALSHRRLKVIFQNSVDKDTLTQIANLNPNQTCLIAGSGVDLSEFAPTPLPSGNVTVVMACRLLANKGVWEFAHAARQLKDKSLNLNFRLAGTIDPDNPASLTQADLQTIRETGAVEILGQRSDIAALFAAAHMVVLPSYYGEGLPKVLIEAAACGRAVITTDMPGCRDAIIPGVSGLLVPARDSSALAAAIEQLARDPARLEKMGKAGRELAQQTFDIQKIVAIHLQIYLEILA